jgi:hypothetical protein
MSLCAELFLRNIIFDRKSCTWYVPTAYIERVVEHTLAAVLLAALSEEEFA